jgi:hypothetical protein
MSTIKVDKIVPFQSSSVEIEGAIVVGGATTGSNDFVGNQTVTGSIDITGEFLVNGSPISGSGGGTIDTASFATTGSNTFDGSQSLTAGVLTVSSGSVGGNRQSSLSSTGLSIVDPTGGMGQAKNIILSANPSPLGGPLAAWTQPTLYGIGTTGPYQIAEFQSQTNFTDGTATFKVPLIVSGGIVVTGLATFNNDTVISPIDTLPAGIPGQIAISGGAMHVYINAQWNEVAFVSTPPPPVLSPYTLTYSDMSSTDACSAVGGMTYYSSNLTTGGTLYTDSAGTLAADNGWYSDGSNWYEVSGSAGEVVNYGTCPTSFQFTTGSTQNEACEANDMSSSTFYSDSSFVSNGTIIYTDTALSNPTADGYYANVSDTSVYEVSGSAGEVVNSGTCPTVSTGVKSTTEFDACDDMGDSVTIYTSNQPGLNVTLYSDASLNTIAADGWYKFNEDLSGRVYLQDGGVIVVYYDCAVSDYFTILKNGVDASSACGASFPSLYITDGWPIAIGTIISNTDDNPQINTFFADANSINTFETGMTGDVIATGSCA